MEQAMKRAIAGLEADYAEIRIERSESTTLNYMGPVLENVGTEFTLGGCVRVCTNGGWGFASFNRIEDALESAHAACEMSRLVSGEGTALAESEPVKAAIRDRVNTDPTGISLEEKCSLLKRYNDLMLKDSEVVTTDCRYRDMKKTVWLHTSDGSMLEQEKVYTGVRFMAVAKDGTNVQRGIKSIGDRTGYESAMNLEAEAENAVRTARDLIRAPKVESGVYTVVINPLLAGVFTHEAFGHLSEADFIYENPKARDMMKLGRRFGPDFLNIVDDGGIESQNGYTPYDDEGVKKGKTCLIKNGILAGRLHSRDTAGHMGEAATGNARAIDAAFPPIVRMTSTYIENGDTTFEEMIGEVKEGIYACDHLGGMTGLERFTFSSGYAYKIENGRITTPLRDVVLSGNVFETLHNIVRVGNDLALFGGLGGCGKNGQMPLPVSLGAPHICIKEVLVG